MGTYGAPYLGRRGFVALFAVSGLWTAVVVVTALGAGEGAFSAPFAAFSLGSFVWNAYWCLYRIAFRVSLRRGVLEWQAPLRTETLWLADIASIRPVALLPNIMSIRRRSGDSLLMLSGKGLPALVAGVVQQRPDLDHALGPWTRLAGRVPGPSWWRPGRHYRSAVPGSPLAPWPDPPPRAAVGRMRRPDVVVLTADRPAD
jgi:hypothetical protein